MITFTHSPPRVYQVGITYGQSPDVWEHDVRTAKAAGIDGFALNIGPQDHHTDEQLTLAYQAAERVGGFVMFISFECVALSSCSER